MGFRPFVCAALLMASFGNPVFGGTADHDGMRPDPLAMVAPSRHFDTIHTRLDLDLDLEDQSIAGSVTHTLQPLRSGILEIRLNCVALDVEEVRVGGQTVAFDYPVEGEYNTSWIESATTKESTQELLVHLPHAFAVGERFELSVNYSGKPKEGLYFIGPEKGIPEKRYEVWSQGEGEDNRYWIPCFDYPNDKATFDGIFRVDKGNYVLSNGELVEQEDVGEKTQFHWRLGTPQVTYLIMVAAGEYEIVEELAGDVTLMYLAPPETDRDTIMRAYGITPEIMAFFSDYIGIDYPFEKYAQVTVQNFIYGGMENTSATVMTSKILHDERLNVTRTQQGLVAHELAHQWWGDMVTCGEWSHIWLNEGFATYFQSLFREHYEGEDAFRYEMHTRHRKVVERDDKAAYPVVVDFYNRADQRNSANVYIKGSSVLHMLRFLLGDESFRTVMRRYGEQFKFDLAETSDLSKVIKRTTGENLDWFFEQWIYLAGHPKLAVTKSWNEETNVLKLTVKQTQAVRKLTPLFRLPLDIDITCAEETETHHVIIDDDTQDLYFALPSKPLMVLVDKDDWILKTLTFHKPTEELIYQAQHGTTMARIRAVRAMGTTRDDARVTGLLGAIVREDGFWGLRREAALALGDLDTDAAASALLDAVEVEDARVRLAVTKAMGQIRGRDDIDKALIKLMRNDYAWDVRAEAVSSLVKKRSDAAVTACLDALKQDSGRDAVRTAGLRGLAALEETDAMDKIKPLAISGNRRIYRHDAISAYAKLAAASDDERVQKETADFLIGMLDDWYLKTRLAVVGALDTLGHERAIEELRQVSTSDPVQAVRTRAAKAVAHLDARREEIAKKRTLETKIESLSRQIESMQKEVEDLRASRPRPDAAERVSRKEGDGK